MGAGALSVLMIVFDIENSLEGEFSFMRFLCKKS
jgi:hypothetical protein